jgi:hypothetical protein
MKVVIDGIIFQYPVIQDIARIYQQILPRMCQMDRSLSIEMCVDGMIQPPFFLYVGGRTRYNNFATLIRCLWSMEGLPYRFTHSCRPGNGGGCVSLF